MASNHTGASLPLDDTATTSRPELPQLRLPLTLNQIREQAQLFEEYLTVASDVLTSRGATLLDFEVSVTYLDSHQNVARFRPSTRVTIAAALEVISGTDQQPDRMTDAPAIPVPDHEETAQTPEAPPIDPATITETHADENGDAPPENPAPAPTTHQCKICMDELTPEATVMINCGCTYCGTCLNDHIMHGLSSRSHYPARCCSAEGIDIGDTAPYLTLEVILRWSEVEAEYKERLPMYCQNKQCSAHIPEGRLGGESKFIDCNSCHTDTCKECKQWRFEHSGKDLEMCPEDIVSKEDRELANSEKWKQCPGCKNLVERSEGCNNMQCECGTEFCYDCGVEYSLDHRCGCQTNPDADGWHHREGEMPDDLADGATDNEYVEMLGRLLVRVDRHGHGPFANAENAVDWLWDHADEDNEGITWDGMGQEEMVDWQGLEQGEEEMRVFQAYERILREQAETADDPANGGSIGEESVIGSGVGNGATAVHTNPATDPAGSG